MEIINFIKGKGKLVSEPILYHFENSHPNQNSSILATDALQFVKLFNSDVALIDDNNYIIHEHNILVQQFNRSLFNHGNFHMYYLYNNNGTLEKWDPMTFQFTSNNSSLYSAILAIIRPHLTFEETKRLLREIIDEPNTHSLNLIAEISSHFFSRGLSHFHFTSPIN